MRTDTMGGAAPATGSRLGQWATALAGALGLALALATSPGAAGAARLDIQHWQTASGARVYFVPAPELPMVDIEVVFDAGSARDGDRAGLARLVSRLLEAGADGLDADAIADRFEGLGAEFTTESLRDMASASLRSLSDPAYLDPAMGLFATLLQDPDFPSDALERERERMRVALRAEDQSPGDIANRTFFRALYGEHPYHAPPSGTPESLSRLDQEAVRAFHRRYYVARNATVAIVGDLERKAAEAAAERIVGALPSGEAASPPPPAGKPPEVQRIHVDFPSSQTHVLAGQPVLPRHDPDYFPLYVGNHILGGSGLVSRISEEVREKRGLAYSAYSYFMPMRAAGPFMLGLQTRNDQTAAAVEVLNETLANFISAGPTPKELEAARRNITGGFPLRIASNRNIAGQLAMIGFYELPLDWLDTFVDEVNAVTPEAIRDAWARRVDPSSMVTVTVGQPAQ